MGSRKTKVPDFAKLTGGKKAAQPKFIEPSLATLEADTPAGASWIHEIKFDGYRIQARLERGKAAMLTRRGLDWTARFSTLANAIEELPLASAMLDGEVVVNDEKGVSSFTGLQAALKAGKQDQMTYMVFDIMFAQGLSLLAVPLKERKTALKALVSTLPATSPIKFSDHLHMSSEQLLKHACRLGLEGIVSKQADGLYISGRGLHWIKSKCSQRQEFVVVGYVPSNAIDKAIGSLVLAYYDKGTLVHVGRVGTGYTNKLAGELFDTMSRLHSVQPTFKSPLATADRRGVKWVAPKLVAEIEYRGWSSDNLLRHAAFKGLREDKPAIEVRLEEEAKT